MIPGKTSADSGTASVHVDLVCHQIDLEMLRLCWAWQRKIIVVVRVHEVVRVVQLLDHHRGWSSVPRTAAPFLIARTHAFRSLGLKGSITALAAKLLKSLKGINHNDFGLAVVDIMAASTSTSAAGDLEPDQDPVVHDHRRV